VLGAHRAAQGGKVASRATPDKALIIPQEAQEIPLAAIPVSERLWHVLKSMNVRVMRDLQGLTCRELGRRRGCGKTTVEELRALVRAVQRALRSTRGAGPAGDASPEAPPAGVAHAFWVPVGLRRMNPFQLPISVRLEGVLRRKGVRRLGDLHDVPVTELKAVGGCGEGTVAELRRLLQRAAAGEFTTEAKVPWSPSALVRTLDKLVEELPDRDRRILLRRLAGEGGHPPTLEEVGAEFRLTRERIRQVMDRSSDRMLRAGTRLRSDLAHLVTFCEESICPLTPSLLRHWLGPSAAPGRFEPAFYVRLAAELCPLLAAWPAGQELSHKSNQRRERVDRGLTVVLGEGFGSVPLADALSRLRGCAGFRRLNTWSFLAALQHSRRWQVEFPQPDAPVVRLAERFAVNLARAVLQRSDTPLTPEEILARGSAALPGDAAGWDPPALACVLARGKGIRLLGPGVFGIRYQLPKPMRRRARADCRGLLERQHLPISALDIVNDRRFAWTACTNAYELACILREDAQLIDLGRFRFSHADWGR
jgi:hypothetical protein